MRGRYALAAALMLCACAPASPPPAPDEAPASVTQGAITLTQAWAPAPPAGAQVAAGYLTIANQSDTPDRLIAAASPAAARVEFHEMRAEGDLMVMRPLATLEAPAHSVVLLAPGGYHLMFFAPSRAFTAGAHVPLTLTFARAGAIELTLAVRARGAGGAGDPHAGHAH